MAPWITRTGYLLNSALLVLLSVGIPLAVYHFYDAARNSDDGLRDALAIYAAVIYGIPLWLVLVALGLLAFGLCQSKRWLAVVMSLSLAAPICIVGGRVVGLHHWQKEFDYNRACADEVSDAVRVYAKEKGTYPERLDEIGTPLTRQLSRGRQIHPLEYERIGPDRFLVSYSYGWNRHIYDSRENCWKITD